MTGTKILDDIINEMDKDASAVQRTGGSLSWRRVREWACRLTTFSIEHATLSVGEHRYLKEHHQITSTGIGLAKIALLRGNPEKAMEYLQEASKEIDDATIKHIPKSALLQGLIDKLPPEVTNVTDLSSRRPAHPSHHREVLPAN